MKRWRKILVLVACFMAIVFIGLLCAYFMANFAATRFTTLSALMEEPPPPPDATTAGLSEIATPSATPILKVALTRKLIREADMTLLVQDITKAIEQIEQVTKHLGGYVAEVSQSRGSDGKWSAELTLRIPSERYSEALSRLRQLGEIGSFRDKVQDVTEEFIDLEARLRNLKRSEQHLLELLKRSGKVSELVQIERELSNRRSEIESLEGRLRYLTHQVTFSTIRVSLVEFRPHPMPQTAFNIAKIFADAFRTTVLILRGILIIMIWIVVLGIIWIPLSALGLWLSRRVTQAKNQPLSSKGE